MRLRLQKRSAMDGHIIGRARARKRDENTEFRDVWKATLHSQMQTEEDDSSCTEDDDDDDDDEDSNKSGIASSAKSIKSKCIQTSTALPGQPTPLLPLVPVPATTLPLLSFPKLTPPAASVLPTSSQLSATQPSVLPTSSQLGVPQPSALPVFASTNPPTLSSTTPFSLSSPIPTKSSTRKKENPSETAIGSLQSTSTTRPGYGGKITPPVKNGLIVFGVIGTAILSR